MAKIGDYFMRHDTVLAKLDELDDSIRELQRHFDELTDDRRALEAELESLEGLKDLDAVPLDETPQDSDALNERPGDEPSLPAALQALAEGTRPGGTISEILSRRRTLNSKIEDLLERISDDSQQLDALTWERSRCQADLDALLTESSRLVVPSSALSLQIQNGTVPAVPADGRAGSVEPHLNSTGRGRPGRTARPSPAMVATRSVVAEAGATGMTFAEIREKLNLSKHATSMRCQKAAALRLIYRVAHGRYSAYDPKKTRAPTTGLGDGANRQLKEGVE